MADNSFTPELFAALRKSIAAEPLRAMGMIMSEEIWNALQHEGFAATVLVPSAPNDHERYRAWHESRRLLSDHRREDEDQGVPFDEQ